MTETPERSPTLILGVAIAGVVLCPFLGPVAVYLADAERKRAVVDEHPTEPLVMVARILGYVGTAILCLDLLLLMGAAVFIGMSAASG